MSDAAMARYGFESAPGRRFSIRRLGGSEIGILSPQERLSLPHWTLIGAALSGRIRRNELTLGANIGVICGSRRTSPAMWLRNNALSRPLLVENTLRPVSMSRIDWWICIELPGWSDIGLARKVA